MSEYFTLVNIDTEGAGRERSSENDDDDEDMRRKATPLVLLNRIFRPFRRAVCVLKKKAFNY